MPDFQIDVQVDVPLPEGLLDKLRTAARATLVRIDSEPDSSVTLVLTADERVQELNLTYRQEDMPTDVLSFPVGEPMPGMEHMPRYLGDVIIAVPYASRQAVSRGYELQEELQLLVVHGLLHLLGHDHAQPEHRRRMWQAQAAILSELDLSHVLPDEE